MTDHTFIPELNVDVPNDGTLSKVVFKNDRVRIVVFGFDTDQELTDHTASMPAIIQVISGKARLTLGADVVEAAPGSWTYMPAGLTHAVYAIEPTVMLLTLLRD
ncbi:MAG TPA: cupin domain-containing protein [Acidimicrobiia bacterium]|nr:cupin domain-containing protein [Acidimicrobiia bacterium]